MSCLSVTVYVDVLFFINLIINYLILCATAILSGRELLKLRTLAVASLGALYSVFIFFSFSIVSVLECNENFYKRFNCACILSF